MNDAFSYGFGTLPLITDAKTRSISAENPTGEPGRGGMATDGGASADRMAHLGQGWKASPWYDVLPGERRVIVDIDGPGVIQSMWFAGGAARQILLRIYWDNQETPSVECPLMEFFAYSWHKMSHNYKKGPFFQLSSIPVAVNPNRGFNCFWPMPFREHCRVEVENRTEQTYRCFHQINYSLEAVADNAAYFHAYFRLANPVVAGEDYVIIDNVKGRGQYVGTALFVGLNGMCNWWGEGEIKFFIDDDDSFPTICGTGTEDYFGGAYDWDVEGEYHTYSSPYMGVHQIVRPDGLYESQQRFSMYRWHIMDPVRFERNLKVTIQDLGLSFTMYDDGYKSVTYVPRRDDMASVAYWYQTLPASPYGEFPSDSEIMFV